MLAAAHRKEFDTVLVCGQPTVWLAASDTFCKARPSKSSRYQVRVVPGEPRPPPDGWERAVVGIVSAVAELERNLIIIIITIIERVKAGLRPPDLRGQVRSRRPLESDRVGLLRDRTGGMSLSQLAKAYKISRTALRGP